MDFTYWMTKLFGSYYSYRGYFRFGSFRIYWWALASLLISLITTVCLFAILMFQAGGLEYVSALVVLTFSNILFVMGSGRKFYYGKPKTVGESRFFGAGRAWVGGVFLTLIILIELVAYLRFA